MEAVAFEPLTIPVREDGHGGMRVGKSRVLLELVIHSFQEGATPETIVQSYDTLDLADVYAVISYYLARPEVIEAYLRRRDQEADAIRRKIEAAQPARPNLHEVLLARAKTMEQRRAATGE